MAVPKSDDAAISAEAQARRDFLKKVGQATASVPAVALLLSASYQSKGSAQAQYDGGGCAICACEFCECASCINGPS